MAENRQLKEATIYVEGINNSKSGGVGVLANGVWYNISSRDMGKIQVPVEKKRYKITYNDSEHKGKTYHWIVSVEPIDSAQRAQPVGGAQAESGKVSTPNVGPESKIGTALDREVLIARENCMTNAVTLTKLYAEVNVTIKTWEKFTDEEVFGFIKQRRKEFYDILVKDVLDATKPKDGEEEIPF